MRIAERIAKLEREAGSDRETEAQRESAARDFVDRIGQLSAKIRGGKTADEIAQLESETLAYLLSVEGRANTPTSILQAMTNKDDDDFFV